MVELFFLFSLFLLFFFSGKVTVALSFLVYRVTKSHTISIRFLSVLFLPGVIIHELSHWLVANILFVPTGEIEFFPQVQKDRVKLGSVEIAKTDFFRRFLIGIAPLFGGLSLLYILFYFLSPAIVPFTYKSLIFLYALFEIGNTMFSSRKDMEGAVGMGVFIALLVLAVVFFKTPLVSIFLSFLSLPGVLSLSLQMGFFCFFALGIDGLLLSLLYVFLRWRKYS